MMRRLLSIEINMNMRNVRYYTMICKRKSYLQKQISFFLEFIFILIAAFLSRSTGLPASRFPEQAGVCFSKTSTVRIQGFLQRFVKLTEEDQKLAKCLIEIDYQLQGPHKKIKSEKKKKLEFSYLSRNPTEDVQTNAIFKKSFINFVFSKFDLSFLKNANLY